MVLRNGLVALCEGAGKMDDAVYRLLRQEFMNDPSTSALVPRFVRTEHDTGAAWAFLKDLAPAWAQRREFVREQFGPLIYQLEKSPVPAAILVSDVFASFYPESVNQAWSKALARRETDPPGAITIARTLLEAVCKHILEDVEGNPAYGPNDDLPKLYRLVAEQLNLAPSQHSEDAFKRILGGATTVVEGLCTLRNRVGDSHASSGRRPVRVAPRHAALAVNMAGSMALFLIETARARHLPPAED